MSYRRLFTRFLNQDRDRLHVAAHRHHPWPDVTFEAQQRAWLDAAALHDDKWELLLGEVLPAASGHVASQLGLPDPRTVAFAPNTHELVLRILSCLPVPTRILTTDSEFYSFARQLRRLEEAELAIVDRIPAEPYSSFLERLCHAATRGDHDLVFFSQVQFNSGFAITDLEAVIAAIPADETFVVIDGYHGFMALPTDLALIANRAFYIAGGYKYAMSGEGICFMHCPPGYGQRPVNTGWFAGFADLAESAPHMQISYPQDAARFFGATFDATGLYRFNAVQRLLGELGLSVAAIHTHVRQIQQYFLDQLDSLGLPGLNSTALVPPLNIDERGHFLSFQLPDASGISQRLRARNIITDYRGERLRFGFGIYHDEHDIDVLCHCLSQVCLMRT